MFDQPEDRIIWDVGHRAYPHKMLTGRRDGMTTMRQTDGLSPFTKRSESAYDCFGAGHSSTSISAGLGMAVARDMQGRSNHVISIIGDGAITGGMAYEAMNNAGYLDTNMIIVLSDNQQVSLPPHAVQRAEPRSGGRAIQHVRASAIVQAAARATRERQGHHQDDAGAGAGGDGEG